jgi:DNA-binding response OmpR family regulator
MTGTEAATILLVEDDMDSAALLATALSNDGHTVWRADSGADARTILKHTRADLIILDLTLPDVDGLVLCAHLTSEAPDVPFMICSSGTTAEKILAFKLGAEDFVTKPYALPEVQARVEAILRRRAHPRLAQRPSDDDPEPAQTTPPAEASSDPRLRVDVGRWRVTLDDKPLDLTPTEFQLLVFMVRRPGQIISRQELARDVWGNESMSRSRTIDAYVRRISTKLSRTRRYTHDGSLPRILNIRGMGYQLSVPRSPAA